MDITHLASFYEVVQRGSFSAAADALGVSKGMLSRHVSALESALNAQLLQRTTRRLSLTEAGRVLHQQAGEIFALAREAEEGIRALTEEDSGRLRFTCPVSTGDRMVSELLARFAELCPGVQVELNFTNAMIDMSQGENDIALRAMELIPDNLVALPLGRLKDVVVASPALLAREGIPATPYELGGRSCLLQGHNPDWEQWHFRQGEEEAHILVQGRVRANHYSTLLQLAQAGMGFAKCPLMLVEASLARGELVAVLTEWQTGLHPIHVLHAQQRRVPRKIRLFKQVLAQWFAERPHYLLG
ncbi:MULTISPECIES: LysR family transcriptional regulator [Aeromonas]|uniref:LysR family transcriptional regulator n=1 Tax=Aeromonas caviae TaxID=648 RepID=A0A7H9FCJ2_AERCA|nr:MULTISPECIES: LysR family transcriptional regulator [Aeromonas]KDV04973.1 LysR family transcriptional regulator [Aeromonas sp. HZM]KMY26912.1 LysR family transcriptional regulator [Aeromonas caviae]KOG96011.1 LysR family transcriptional regulator [Aeromonas caviae]MBL0436622.1 LysR family transcriptional regulator [Aeromonas caviae]MBL0535983.1 LysR family transcriptional regulator [Aeromonas caviae]